jgi:transcriptional regulator with XRE-family HTH domain
MPDRRNPSPLRIDGRWRTEGRRLLIGALQSGLSRAELALRIGVSVIEIGHYLCGRARPTIDVAFALERWGVPAKSWTVPPFAHGMSVESARDLESAAVAAE